MCTEHSKRVKPFFVEIEGMSNPPPPESHALPVVFPEEEEIGGVQKGSNIVPEKFSSSHVLELDMNR